LLNRADKEAGGAKYGTPDEVKETIVSSEKALCTLAGPLKALTTRRNSWLAHTDPRTLTDPVKMAAAARINFPDLKRIFSKTGKLVNEFSRLFRDTTSMIDLIDQTDYETVIEFVSKVKCEQVRQYEAEFKQRAPFPRPRGCEQTRYRREACRARRRVDRCKQAGLLKHSLFVPNSQNWGDRKCLGDARKSFVGRRPDAILFLRISGKGVFQQPQALTPTTPNGHLRDGQMASSAW
jgi:hypothetical protein